MALVAFKRVYSKKPNNVLDELQNNLEAALQALPNSLILDGQLLEGVVLGTTATLVAHKLGRLPNGWFVVRPPDVYVNSYREVSRNATHIEIDTNYAGSVVVDLWVF